MNYEFEVYGECKCWGAEEYAKNPQYPEPEHAIICADQDSCVRPPVVYRKEDKQHELTPEQKEALEALPY